MDRDIEARGIANSIDRLKRDLLKKTQGTAAWSQNSTNIANGILSWIGLGSDALDLYDKATHTSDDTGAEQNDTEYEYNDKGQLVGTHQKKQKVKGKAVRTVKKIPLKLMR